MKRISNAIKYISQIGILLITFLACDQDYTTIESDIEGITNFTNDAIQFPVGSYNRMLGPVQTNNMSSNLMGIYNDPVYGKTLGNIVTQVAPTSYGFDFPEGAAVDSVILLIPYYAKSLGTNSEGKTEYELDSLFGDEAVKLSIYQNNYFLRDLDPNSDLSETQKYYSNANETINFDNFRGDTPLYTDNNFIPSDEEQDIAFGEKTSPSLKVDLDNTDDFWDNLFFFNTPDAGSQPEISNPNNFKNYFRGLYFKIEEKPGSEGNMIMMGFSQGNITVYYSWVTEIIIDDNGDLEEVKDNATIRMNFAGNRLNTLENDPTNTVIADANANADPIAGDQSLYIKGGEGSMAVIDLFNGLIEDPETGTDVPALEYFKSKKDTWLINEANLTLYVDQDQVNSEEPNRIMLMDIKNNVPIIDYYFDPTTNSADPSQSKILYSNVLERNSDDEGVKYKFRLTEHLNNILLQDSTNVQLGIYVSTNVNEIQQATALEYVEINSNTGSVLSPRGTVLYGSNQNVADNQKVKFEIYYTEPNN